MKAVSSMPSLIVRHKALIPRPLWLLFGTPSVHGPELASKRVEHSLLWRMSSYIFDILFLSPYMFV